MKEYIYHVDENDNVIGKVERDECYKKKHFFRVSRVIILNNKGEFLIQKRSPSKKTGSNKWDFGIAETLIYGESYEEAAVRGLKEELSIKTADSDLKFLFKLKYLGERRGWSQTHLLIYNGDIKKDDKEVSEAKFVSEDFLNKMLETEKFFPVGLRVYKEYKNKEK